MKLKTLLVIALLCSFAVFYTTADADTKEEPAATEGGDAAEAEADTTSPDGFSQEELEALRNGEEKHEFQAEVSRLMDIIINSLYSNREIFLRELVSNASDALDKIRFLSIKDKSALDSKQELEIKIKLDKDKKTISIRDSGIGMTKEELKQHLGVVANTGTTKFLEAAQKSDTDTLSLIGQFGVGFYSVYLVADRVTVVSKSNDDDKQWVWSSDAQGTFSISEDPRGNTLGRGTDIILHLKDDASEFLEEGKLKELVQRYSQFINFPIYLWESKTVDKEVPVEEDDEDSKDDASDEDKKEDDVEVSDDEDPLSKEDKEKPEVPKTKTIQETVWDWEQANSEKAIWTRSKGDVEQSEYEDFYKALTKDEGGALSHTHFSAEGEIQFKAILYVPKTPPRDLYDKYYGKSNALKLYVRRVLISDEFEDLMPRYLNFIRGVVDSEDLPLNVSRETLSKSRVLKVMSKKLTRKALDMLRKLANAQVDAMDEQEEADKKEKEEKAAKKEEEKDSEDKDEDKDKEEKEETEEEKEKKAAKKERKKTMKKYFNFWKNYGKSIKLGVIEDGSNKSKLQKLLRFDTSKSKKNRPISLEQYINRMKEGQEFIYYITGENLKAVKNSPFLERLNKKGFEVLFMVDALDEYLMSNMQDYDGKKFMSITKEGLKFGDEDDEDSKAREKARQEHYEVLTKWLKDVYGDKVEKVVTSNRVTTTPAVLVTGQWGWSANMERIMKAQTFSDASKQAYMISKKTMEINTRHPIVRELRRRADENPDDQTAKDLANLMFDSALLQSGFQMENTKEFASRIQRVMKLGLSLEADAPVADEDDFEIPEKEEENDDDVEDLDETSGATDDDSSADEAAADQGDAAAEDKPKEEL